MRYPSGVLTVISWFDARKSRKTLQELVARALTDKPTVLCIVSDKFTNRDQLRPFVPLADRFGDKLHFILAAEWEEDHREREGATLLRGLGLAAEQRPALLHDTGPERRAVVLRQKQPIALIDLFFQERGRALDGGADPRHEEFLQIEDAIAAELEKLLVRLPPQPPPPLRALQAGEHDFTIGGVCHCCGDGRSTLRICPGRRDDGPKHDRFELIELD